MDERKFEAITPLKILEYCYAHSKMMTGKFDQIEARTREHGQINMLTGPWLGKFLSMISSVIRPHRILEVGGFTGYGSACLAQGLEEGGKLISIEKNSELKDFSRDLYLEMGIENKIEQHIGDALELIENLDETFDLVFIDAAKRQYIKYYELVLPKLRKGGVILADNTLWKGSLVEDELDKLGKGLDQFNKHIVQDKRVDNILLPIDDGLHFIVKR